MPRKLTPMATAPAAAPERPSAIAAELPGGRFESFEEDGFVIVRGLFDPADLFDLVHEFEAFESSENAKSSSDIVFEKDTDQIKYLKNINRFVPAFSRLFDSELLRIAADLLGERAYFQTMELHDKAPLVGSETPPHQDGFYFCYSPPSALTSYVALDPHLPDNGGLRFVPGSQHRVRRHEPSLVVGFSARSELTEADIRNSVALSLRPGDASFHHCNLLHYAPANRSTSRRRAISIRVTGVSAARDQAAWATYRTFRDRNRGTA